MLLATLSKYTSELHPDHADINEALAAVKQINMYINDRKKKEDNKRKVKQVLSSIVSKNKATKMIMVLLLSLSLSHTSRSFSF